VIEPGAAASFIVIVPVSAQQTNTFPPTIRPEPGEYRLQIPMRIELVGAVFEFSHDRSVSESFNVVVQ
jgi:hypothetical protein